jgi:hypothetical protein
MCGLKLLGEHLADDLLETLKNTLRREGAVVMENCDSNHSTESSSEEQREGLVRSTARVIVNYSVKRHCRWVSSLADDWRTETRLRCFDYSRDLETVKNLKYMVWSRELQLLANAQRQR